MSVIVHLTEERAREAKDGATDRTLDALLKRRSLDGSPSDRMWENGIRGALAEQAVCQWLGIPWHATVGQLNAKDAGPYMVRSSHLTDGKLLLRGTEVDSDDIYIFVVGAGLQHTLHGWMFARACKREAFRQPTTKVRPVPWWLVPQDELLPMKDLPALEVGESSSPQLTLLEDRKVHESLTPDREVMRRILKMGRG